VENSPRLASCSKDSTIKIWNTRAFKVIITLSGHVGAVNCIRWGGQGRLYSGSQDKTIRIWDVDQGRLLHILSAHAHWINTMSLSTDYAIRTGAFDHTGTVPKSASDARQLAQKRFREAYRGGEKLVTGSDDFTMYLWTPETSEKPVARLIGIGYIT
jgi:ribosome assembly protein 4